MKKEEIEANIIIDDTIPDSIVFNKRINHGVKWHSQNLSTFENGINVRDYKWKVNSDESIKLWEYIKNSGWLDS